MSALTTHSGCALCYVRLSRQRVPNRSRRLSPEAHDVVVKPSHGRSVRHGQGGRRVVPGPRRRVPDQKARVNRILRGAQPEPEERLPEHLDAEPHGERDDDPADERRRRRATLPGSFARARARALSSPEPEPVSLSDESPTMASRPSSRRRRSRDVVNPSQHRATANSNGADEPHPSTHPSTQLPERDAATQLARLASTQLAQLLAARFGVFEAAPNPTAYARIITIAHDFCVRTLTQYGAVHHGHLGPPTELWALQRDHPPAHDVHSHRIATPQSLSWPTYMIPHAMDAKSAMSTSFTT